MVLKSHFLQECPVCGRPLEILKEHLGERVSCCHCGGYFVADDFGGKDLRGGNLLMRRADYLLQLATRRLNLSQGFAVS